MDELVTQLHRRVQEKYYGKFRALVAENEDPDQLGRVKVRIPSVLGEEVSGWALPCVPFGGLAGQGWFFVPEVDAQVWVEFEEGDLRRPIWSGTFWQQKGDPPQDAQRDEPTARVLQTPSGHVLQLDDSDDDTKLRLHHPEGSEVLMDKNGSVSLTDKNGATVTLDAENGELRIEDSNGNSIALTSTGTTVEDANGNVVDMTASGVKVKGQKVVLDGTQVLLGGEGGEPVIKGQSFLTLFATHVHGSAMGPTSPPVPQGEMSTLSMSVMTK